jgi:hypothetical protein
VCLSSSIGSCLMTAYPHRCRRSSPEPPLATIRLLHHRAPSSRPASATSTPPRRVGKSLTVKPCPVGRSRAVSAPGVNTAPPSLPADDGHVAAGALATMTAHATHTHVVGWQVIARPRATTRARLGRPRPGQPWASAPRRTVAVGRMRSPALCGRFNRFPIYLIPRK